LCALEVVKINILGVCYAKGSVFLEGFKVTSLVVLCVICIWLLSGLPSGFWWLDVALSLRVNQYKLFVYLFLPLNSFKFSCYWFAGVNNRLFFLELCCFVLYILANWIFDWVSFKGFCSSLKSFQKPPLNNSPPSRLRPYILTHVTTFHLSPTRVMPLLSVTRKGSPMAHDVQLVHNGTMPIEDQVHIATPM